MPNAPVSVVIIVLLRLRLSQEKNLLNSAGLPVFERPRRLGGLHLATSKKGFSTGSLLLRRWKKLAVEGAVASLGVGELPREES